MVQSLGKVKDASEQLRRLTRDGDILSFTFDHDEYYIRDSPTRELHTLCWKNKSGLFAIVTPDGVRLQEAVTHAGSLNEQELDDLATRIGAAVIKIDAPLALEIVRIPKPWGAEIWYTGIEQRGVCTTGGVPLPWLIDLAGPAILGTDAREPLLLKILDPLPDEVYGDLYFEMHEEKLEVYVVTHVDETAWPDGEGAIRFGFDPMIVARFPDREAFKRAYIDLVDRYRKVRLAIDREFDVMRSAAGIRASDVVAPEIVEGWKAQIDPSLNERERALREEMNTFSVLEPLVPGDVVQVPPFTPHSLQHGVRVVEFQTAHYERFILSFAQKVLTQDHWDTEEAIGCVNWDAQFGTSLSSLPPPSGAKRVTVERIADFDAFEVQRFDISANETFSIPNSRYAILMAITGNLVVNGLELAPEAACLIPRAQSSIQIHTRGGRCRALLAFPR